MNRQDTGGQRIWRLIYPSLTYLGITMIVGMIVSMVIVMGIMPRYGMELTVTDMEQILIEALEGYYARAVEIQTISTVLSLPLLVIFFQKDRKRRLHAGHIELLADRAPVWMALIAVFGAIAAYAGNGMISLSGLFEVSDTYEEIASVIYQGNLGLELLCFGILTPIVEELIFRGLMYTQLTEYMKKKWAIVLAALLFGAYHGNFIQALYGFCLGLLMIYVYERFHTLLAPILFHVGANTLGVLMSETTAFSFLYRTTGAMYTSVILSSLMIIGIVWVIENRNQRQQIE